MICAEVSRGYDDFSMLNVYQTEYIFSEILSISSTIRVCIDAAIIQIVINPTTPQALQILKLLLSRQRVFI